MEKFFHLKEHGTNIRTEVIAGITTFVTMAYILFVNPDMLSHGDSRIYNGVLFATCISAFIGTLLMGLWAKIPFAQASGMGLNAFFSFSVMPAMASLSGDPSLSAVDQYQMALAVVFISGIFFILITLFGVREAIVQAIPHNIKLAISGGIGLFIAFVGLQGAGIVVASDSTLVSLAAFSNLFSGDAASKQALLGAVLAVVGLILIAALAHFRVKGAILIGIVSTTILCYLTGAAHLPEGNLFSFNLGQQTRDFVEVSFFKMDFTTIFAGRGFWQSIATILILVVSFSLVDMFNTIGTLIGTAKQAGLLDENGRMPQMKQALMCDAVATTAGAALGTSTVTTYVESGAGIGEGGRTGLTSVVTSLFFLAALLFAPFAGLVPSAATAPALIYVGALMMNGMKELDFSDPTEAIPAFLTIVLMPLTYSISNGIAFGLISYLLIKLLCGKVREIHPVTAILGVFFLISFFVSIA
ncbi:putative permease [[Clostridium] methylpentosum DSM 5476]|uniref:Putative permease n=1 Tax=[Clostridium] methylpentosum DSM 5476 TaxID=537013 RepID=C0E956_9FIRM|nr:putative permease [[Clostridium] methylpentosum DSM 5476]MDY3989519.1 NCS2 family permease [Massilioclostridium sp.]